MAPGHGAGKSGQNNPVRYGRASPATGSCPPKFWLCLPSCPALALALALVLAKLQHLPCGPCCCPPLNLHVNHITPPSSISPPAPPTTTACSGLRTYFTLLLLSLSLSLDLGSVSSFPSLSLRSSLSASPYLSLVPPYSCLFIDCICCTNGTDCARTWDFLFLLLLCAIVLPATIEFRQRYRKKRIFALCSHIPPEISNPVPTSTAHHGRVGRSRRGQGHL
jgi:hypothetical protein